MGVVSERATGNRPLSPIPYLQPLRFASAQHLPLHRGGKVWWEVARSFVPRPPSKKKRVYGRNMVPPVRSRAARAAVPQWRFRRNARDRKGELAGPQALTEGLWVSYRSGQPVTGRFLLYHTYNPFASHSLSTSPYTGEARCGGKKLAPHHFAGQRPKGIGPAALRCGAFVHFPPAESGQKGRRGAFVPKAKCPPDPPFACSKAAFI